MFSKKVQIDQFCFEKFEAVDTKATTQFRKSGTFLFTLDRFPICKSCVFCGHHLRNDHIMFLFLFVLSLY